MTRVLIVEDDATLSRALTITLRARGYEVQSVGGGASALAAATASAFDLVILDLGLPDIDGTQVIEGLRGWSQVPIIVLSARDTQEQKVDALDAGADDYVTKPFGMGELLARMRVALRRLEPAEPGTAGIVENASFTLDLAAKRALHHGREVRLTPTEWHLVEALVRRPDVLVPGTQLLSEVWGPKYERETNYLRVYFAQIRRKLEDDPSHPRHFITEPGLGYRYQS